MSRRRMRTSLFPKTTKPRGTDSVVRTHRGAVTYSISLNLTPSSRDPKNIVRMRRTKKRTIDVTAQVRCGPSPSMGAKVNSVKSSQETVIIPMNRPAVNRQLSTNKTLQTTFIILSSRLKATVFGLYSFLGQKSIVIMAVIYVIFQRCYRIRNWTISLNWRG